MNADLAEPVGARVMRACGIFSLHDSSKNGGLETYIRTLGVGLERSGVKVYDQESDPTQVGGLAKCWHLRKRRMLSLMTRNKWRWIARLYAENIGSSSFNSIVSACDVVHFVGTGWDLAGFALARSARRHAKLITCLPAVHATTWGDSPLDLDFYNITDAVLTLSHYEADHLATLGLPVSKTRVCGCASTTTSAGDGNRFRRSRNLVDKKLVLFIGRKSLGKGYHALRSAMSSLTSERKDLVLVSIGANIDIPFPYLNPAVDVDLGIADEETKRDALAACDIFVLPSDAESFGIVYIEAWANGKPVICGTAPASRELIEKHRGGLTTDGTPTDIAQSIAQLLDNPAQAAEMGSAGMRAAAREYTIENVTNRHLSIWEDLLARPRRQVHL